VSVRSVLADAAARLESAGVPSARVDAELLLAHVLGVGRGSLLLHDGPDAAQRAELEGLVARRAAREPLQHLIGSAVLGPVEVAVGPGVFVPRPETEVLLAWALDGLRRRREPLVVDLCTGSGALALALAAARPDAVVHAVELDPDAAAWARRNLAARGTPCAPVTLHEGDVTAPDVLAELDGAVDLVVANPPYVPSATPVSQEVRHDPARAVFAGDDGLDVLTPMIATAARLLRPGGQFGTEHDESHGDAVADLMRAAGFEGVVVRDDLTGRPRLTTGSRAH
jgi:release factor glutamine methyltransferase